MNAHLIRLLALAAIGIGVWQCSSGTYLYAKAWLAQRLIASAWMETLDGKRAVKPWPWADTWPVARLIVPDLDVDLFVLADATGRSLAFGPGQLSGMDDQETGAPLVIAGHRDTHFRFLKQLAIGTPLWLEAPNGQRVAYRVIEGHIVDIRHELLQIADPATLALMTCYPFDAINAGGPLRYIAIARREEVVPLPAHRGFDLASFFLPPSPPAGAGREGQHESRKTVDLHAARSASAGLTPPH